MSLDLSRCRVVLVRPHFAGNVGSVARAMKNFGLRDLVLVDPVANHHHLDATMMAVHASDVLREARVVPTLAEAVADCGFVLATSGEVGGVLRKGFWGSPEEKIAPLLDALAVTPAAIVFGPEPSGLTVPEVAACHAMVTIPVDLAYPSLNLAQAVAVCLYELRRQWGHRTADSDPHAGLREVPATYEEQEQLFVNLREALRAVRFLWDFRADGLFYVIRHTIARSLPTTKEVRVWHGLASQLRHVARFWGVTHPDDGRPPPLGAKPPEAGDIRGEPGA